MELLKSQLRTHLGSPVWRLPLHQLSNELAENPLVKDYYIQRSWPDAVHVEITPKDIAGVLKKGTGFALILDDGSLVENSSLHLPDTVVLVGKGFEEVSSERLRALRLYRQLPEQGVFSQARVSEIGLDDKRGIWIRLIGAAFLVYMGDEGWGEKAPKISQVMNYLKANGIEARVIEANLTKKVVVKMRKDP